MKPSRNVGGWALAYLLFASGCGKAAPKPSIESKPEGMRDARVDTKTQDESVAIDSGSSSVASNTISSVFSDAGDIAEGAETADANTLPADASDAAVAPRSLCEKYGGPESVASVVSGYVVPALTGDCRINAYFAALSEPGVQRVGECLSIQVQELFGCAGVTYAGSHATNGLPCRSMAKAHIGLQISQGDFDALIEDVVSALTSAGVAAEDIGLAAPALLGMQADIVEQPTTMPALNACE